MVYVPSNDDVDVDFNGIVNFNDALRIAQLTASITPSVYSISNLTYPLVGIKFVYDVNRDGIINFPGDVITTATRGQISPRQISRYHGRNPYKQPFASSSIWNTPIGASATRVATSFHVPELTFHEDEYIIMAPGYSLTVVEDSEDAWTGGDRCTKNTQGFGPIYTGVPLPGFYTIPGASQGDTPNNSAAILGADRRTWFQCQPLTHCTTTSVWTAFSGEYPGTTHQDLFSHGMFGVHGGSGLSAIGGCVRVHELVPGGKIPHAIKWVISSDEFSPTVGRFGGAGFRYPAITSDAANSRPSGGGPAPTDYIGTNIRMMPGSLLALKTSFDVATLLTEPGRILGIAMQKYGGYVVDAGFEVASDDRHPWYFGTEAGTDGSVRTNFETYWPTLGPLSGATSGDWFDDIVTIVGNLEIIDDNGPATCTGTATNVAATSMTDNTNDWWKFYDLTGGVITIGSSTATITSNSTSAPTLNFTSWTGGQPAVGAYSISWSGYTTGGAGTRLGPVAAAI